MCPPTLPHNMGPNVDVRDLITVDCDAPKIWLDWILIKCVCVCWVPYSAYTQVIWAWFRIARNNYKSTKMKKKKKIERERESNHLLVWEKYGLKNKNLYRLAPLRWNLNTFDGPLSSPLMDLNTSPLTALVMFKSVLFMYSSQPLQA